VGGSAIVTGRIRMQRGANGIDRAIEDRGQRMLQWGASRAVHGAVTGSGRIC